ncbi:hypothetical protein DFQ01_105240 [Paenibacillus cellulosilyticus]|uniref:Uncharacterized protein n=1 Tax=Paenibacillus cellulosilyticus TaxID=375489 RepID=A0A2V2YWX3_9BACL|nr:hypothetical protein [Paenibacillus cellulosilyticus]PWW05256.1 hypothetical protein DFQ01_105240 [Paenibacillus cellulosilyticus]QKS43580.1 hypothetical protein HUB94_03340 [Paenibacillus cellulosilyticus]
MKRKWLAAFTVLLLVVMMSFTVSSSAAPSTYVHGVFSTSPLYVKDGVTGNWLTATSGNAIASWTENPLSSGDQGFFNAIVYVGSVKYEFRLVSLSATTTDQIDGTFDIYVNNTLTATVNGTVYGLSQPVGNYFKFYDSAYNWHVSAYITSRLDY